MSEDRFVPRALHRFLQDAAGYTLVESVVALSLLLSVLLPLTVAFSYTILQPRNEEAIVALALGQGLMEETLGNRDYRQHEAWSDGKQWRFSRDVQKTDRLMAITVRVYRGSRVRPLVELTTMRRVP